MMDLYTVSGILSIYALFVLSSGGRAEGQDEPCSARQQSEVQNAGRACKDACQSPSDCNGPRECVCDGVCGLSCVNTGKTNYCPSLDRPAAGSQLISQEAKSYGTIARYLCDPGYELLSGDLIRRCRGDRTWSGLPPNCAIPDCPIKEAEITDTDRSCRQTCINDTDCAANQRCLCDDICGFTCIPNTQVDYCEAIPEIDHVQTTYDRPSRIFGTVATFECEVGYTRQLGNPTWSRTCEGDGTWSGEDLNCTKILSCPDPEQVPDAEIDESYESDLYVPGDLVYYRCNHGYYREGYAYIRCQEDETWTESAIECRAKSCGLPPIPQNGAIDGAVYSYGTTIKTYCNPGYRLSGLPYRTCQGDQTWSGFDPSCIRIECPKLYPPANGMMEPEDRYTFETEVQITCDLGFVPDGDRRKSCLANRRWSGDGLRFACRDVNCGDPGTPDNGIKIGNSYGYNSVVFFECENNFELSGSVSTVCNAEEQWTESIPRCVGHCVLEAAQDRVSWSRRNLRAGTRIDDGVTLEWECDPSWLESLWYTYRKNSQEPWRCNNGVWSYQPQCLESPCSMLSNTSSTTYTFQPPIQPGNGVMVPSQGVATVWCHQGYQLTQLSSSPRCDRGNWIDLFSEPCQPEPCNILSDIDNGEVSYSPSTHSQTVVHDTLATYTCEDGYRMSRVSATNLCQFGQWVNSQAPTCTPVPCDVLHIQRGTIEYDPPISLNDEVPSDTQATYQCNEGLQFEEPGTGIRRCERGTWTSRVPRCAEKPCAKFSEEPDDHWTVTYSPTFSSNRASVSHEAVATLRCDNGYRGDVMFKTCNRGSWNPDLLLPVCNPAPCTKFEDWKGTVDYSISTTNNEVPHRTNATFSNCGYGLRLSQNNRVLMCHLGDWHGETVCIPLPCESEREDFTHGSITYRQNGVVIDVEQPYHGVQRDFVCNEGYTLSGDQTSPCIAGQWMQMQPVCLANPCDPITPGNHVADVDYNTDPLGDQYSDGTEATIVCDQQTAIVDESDGSVRCSAGVWEPNIPICGTHNLALGKFANQSSIALNSPAGRAVDGDTISTSAGNSCTHTEYGDNEPWWYVDLGDQYNIDRINIVNYNDPVGCRACKRRLQGAVVRVSGSWNPSTLSDYTKCGNTVTRDQANSGQPIEFNCNQPTRGRFISVQLMRPGDVRLQLCEVQVFGSGPVQGCIVPAIPHGYVLNNPQSVRYSPDEIVTSQQGYIYYRCDAGYTRQGTYHYNTCQEDRDWAFQHSTCEPSCIVPAIPNGYVLNPQSVRYSPDEIVTSQQGYIYYQCDAGYTRQGTYYYNTCQEDRDWAFQHSTCEPNSCSVRRLDRGRVYTQSPASHGTVISFTCDDEGWEKNTNEEISCQYGSLVPQEHGCRRSTSTTHQSAPCSEPAATDNGIYELIEGTQYRENAVIQYTCHTGYTTNEATLSQCRNEKWNNPPPTCTRDPEYSSHGESCGIMTVRPNAAIFYRTGEVYPPVVTSLPHNAVVLVSCLGENQHELQSTCVNGQWSIPLQSCDRSAYSSCQVPALPVGTITQNGGVVAPSTNLPHLSVVIINCDDGPFSSSRCNDGRWEVSLQSCVKTSCPRPPSTDTYLQQFINDTVNLEQDTRQEFPIGTYIISRCADPGKKSLEPAGSVSRECTNRGWTGEQPTCKSVGVRILIGGRNIRQLRNNGTLVIQAGLGTVEISCQSFNDYPVFFAPHITRVVQGHVSGKNSRRFRKYNLRTPQFQDSGLFSCRKHPPYSPVISFHIQVKDARCPDPGTPQNGQREGDDFNMNRQVTFSCQQGYSLEGASPITCNVGEWSDSTPTCRFDQCPHYTLNDDNVRELAGSGYHNGAIRIFQCREGFTNADGETGVTSECMDNGQWSPEVPQCNVLSQPDNPTTDDPCATKECEVWETCVDGTCYCLKPNLCPPADDLVCGSDNREYDSVCHLKATACFFRRPITVEKIGEACPEDFGSLSSSLSSSDNSPEDEASVPPEIVGDVSDPPIDDPPIDESVCADCESLSLDDACQRANYAFIGNIVDVDIESQEYQLNITYTYWGNIPSGVTPIIPSVENNCACPRLNTTTQDLLILTQSNHNGPNLQLISTDFVALAADYPIDMINRHETCRDKIR